MVGPVIAFVALTFVVWAVMFAKRIPFIQRSNFPIETFRSRHTAAEAFTPVAAPADNLQNLFEMPVLFYALAAVVLATGTHVAFIVPLAWAYVLLRAAHSFIHCTYNAVMHRFGVYLASCLVLLAMWVLFAIAWLG